MPQHIAQLLQHQPGLAHVALKAALAQVLAQGLADLVLVPPHAGFQAGQRRQAAVHLQCRAGEKPGALPVHQRMDGLFCHNRAS